ncbi:MAG: TetR/AcrR family transcriptional regulator [Stenotrophobium sp.]
MPRRAKTGLPRWAPVVTSDGRRRGYAGHSGEELLAQRRERLLETGLTLFTTRGYHKTPIELICSEARVTTRHFYEQFDSREALLAAVFDASIDYTRRHLAAAMTQPCNSASERIANAIRALVCAYAEDPRQGRIVYVEAVGVSADMERRRRAVIHEFAHVVEAHAAQLAQAGEVPQRDYRLSCVALVGAINELLTEWLSVPQPPTAQELTDEMLSLLQAMILGAQAHVPDLMRGRRLTARS